MVGWRRCSQIDRWSFHDDGTYQFFLEISSTSKTLSFCFALKLYKSAVVSFCFLVPCWEQTDLGCRKEPVTKVWKCSGKRIACFSWHPSPPLLPHIYCQYPSSLNFLFRTPSTYWPDLPQEFSCLMLFLHPCWSLGVRWTCPHRFMAPRWCWISGSCLPARLGISQSICLWSLHRSVEIFQRCWPLPALILLSESFHSTSAHSWYPSATADSPNLSWPAYSSSSPHGR